MFRAPLCSSSGESIVLIRYLVYVTLCRWLSSVQTWTLDSHLHKVTYTRYRINTIDSPDDEYRGARNMYRIEINIYEKKNVHQVGYLWELNWNALSTKHKILQYWFIISVAERHSYFLKHSVCSSLCLHDGHNTCYTSIAVQDSLPNTEIPLLFFFFF
jgi:hypothetical protein